MRKLILTTDNVFDFDFIRILLNKLNISFQEETIVSTDNELCEESIDTAIDTEREIHEINNDAKQEASADIRDRHNEVFLVTDFNKKNNNTNYKKTNKNFNFTYSEETIKAVYKTIQVIQKNYFNTGLKKYIIPMILIDVAEIIGKDVSTVSKILDNAQYTLNGKTLFYKELFTEHDFSTFDGRPVSRFEVLHIIEEYIKNEDKKSPFTDDFLEKELQARGYNIKRRTIAKYRNDILNIPNTFERKDKK